MVFQPDHPTAVPALPSPDPVGSPGWFEKKDPSTATPGTRIQRDWLNMVTAELKNAVEEMGLTPDKGNNFQLAQALAKLGGGSRNLIINPEGQIAQFVQGVPATITDTEVLTECDHWWAKAGGAGDVGKLFPGSGIATDVLVGAPSRVQSTIQWRKTVDNTTGVSPTLRQSIEGIHWFAGQPVVVAFDAIKLVGNPDVAIVGVEIEQDFGTGSADSDVATALTAITNTTIDDTWRRFVFKGTLPGLAGKDINDDAHLKMRVSLATDQLFDVYVTAFVVTRGTQDPGYIPRGEAAELIACKRFREVNRPASGLTDGMKASAWDFALSRTSGDAENLKDAFAVDKYPHATPATVWYAHDFTANAVTEGASTVHTVTSQADGVNGTGFPRLTAPPAGGTLRLLRAFWQHEAEIPD